MRVELSFTPPPADVPPNKFQFFALVNYTMFPEMREEFKETQEEQQLTEPILMETEQGENAVEYFFEIELPYGDCKPEILFRPIDGQQSSGDQAELQPLAPELLEWLRYSRTPEPISRETQQLQDEEEERANKDKERQARQAQKELEQRKAKQKAEAQ